MVYYTLRTAFWRAMDSSSTTDDEDDDDDIAAPRRRGKFFFLLNAVKRLERLIFDSLELSNSV